MRSVASPLTHTACHSDAEYPTEDNGYMRLYYPAGLQRMTALKHCAMRVPAMWITILGAQWQQPQAGLDA